MLLVVSEDSIFKEKIWPKCIEGKHVEKKYALLIYLHFIH